MTATTTIQGSRPTHSRRPVLAHVAFALAGAAIGSFATAAITDGDDGRVTSPRTETAPLDAAASTGSAVSVSADAVEARASTSAPASGFGSADSVERWATADQAGRARACTSSATSADAAERCLSAG
jgi:hypothetical protein